MESKITYKRRWGDRSDGRLIRSRSPMDKVEPYILVERCAACNMFSDELDIAPVEHYIHEKRREGLDSFGILHVLAAAYVRGLSQRPGVNRFISGQKLYARDNRVELMMDVKKEMTTESPDTVVSVYLDTSMTAKQVYEAINAEITAAKAEASDFDGLAKIVNCIPGLIKKFSIWFLKLLDYFGLLPPKLLHLSPFHGSLFITSMGSLGVPPVFHHLYNFGNVPVFCSFGAKQRRYETQRDGSVREVRYIKYNFTMDERICDGFYFASMFKLFKSYLKNPDILDNPPETVEKDID